jgi:hypothetical protein
MYLSLVQYAGLAYIANFTLQRISEAAFLRADCLQWEFVENLGSIPIICGETTKTEEDSDARWPTSPSVQIAIESMKAVSNMRMRCSTESPFAQPTEDDIKNPYLFTGVSEPWCHGKRNKKQYSTQIHHSSYSSICKRYPLLFNEEEIRIRETDLKVARMLTPNLNDNFSIGNPWPFSWHQLRRTGAVNMFMSDIISDSTVQFLMKHASRFMPLYYAQGYTKLLLNKKVEAILITTMYESMAVKLQIAVGPRFVSPLGEDRKQLNLINLVSEKDTRSLIESAKNGEISFRPTRIGACTHRGTCPYGGVESISRCAGGDGGSPCGYALYDKEKSLPIKNELAELKQIIADTAPNSPRYKALQAERKAMENFLDVIGNESDR